MPDDLEDSQEPSRLRELLENEAALRQHAETELADLRRQAAFRDAGLDPQNKLHQVAMKGYDGDLTSEAVNSWVDDLGLKTPAVAPLPETPPPLPPPVPLGQQEALTRIAEAARDSMTTDIAPDQEKRIRDEMAQAARKLDNTRLDQLAEELTRTRGYQSLNDIHPR